MKTILTSLLAFASLSVLAGCAQKQAEAPAPPAPEATVAAVQTAYPQGSIKTGDKAVCVVCNKNGGMTEPEPVAATLDYKDKTYAFCNEEEKAQFISNPANYAEAS